MDPRLRAIADRYILDVANVRFIADSLPDEALDRRVVDSQWSVRQVLAHLASKTATDGRAIELLASGEGLQAGGKEPSGASGETLDSILERLAIARDAVVAGLSTVPAVGDDEATTLDQWSRHYARHGIDLVEALPELRTEPMVLNWLLYADFRDEPVALRRQQALMAEVRDRYPHSGEHEQGDGDES